MVDEIVRIAEFGYYANLFHTGDTKEADNPIDNIMCQDILINVIFDCESELWRLRSGELDICLPIQGPG